MSRRFAHITQSRLLRNSTKLLSANVIAQVIGLIVYPILTRLYSPEDFGLLNLFLSIGGILVLLSTAEYQYAIVLPKHDKEACTVFHVAFRVLLVATGVVLLSVPFSRAITNVFDAPQLAGWYWAMPVYVFTMGLWSLLNYYYTRRQAFNQIGCYQLSQSILSASSKAGMGYAGWLQGGMILGSVFAPLLSVVGSMWVAWKKGLLDIFCSSTKDERKEMAHRYANFPKFNLPRALVNNVGGNMPALLLTPFFGLSELGFLGMAFTLAFRPINLISSSVYQVLFQRTTELVNTRQSIRHLIYGFLQKATLIVLPSFALLYFVMPWLVELLLGDGWTLTSTYIRFFLPWLFFSFLVAPICFLSDIFQKQKTGLFFEILFFLARLGGIVTGIVFNDFQIAVLGYSIGGSIVICSQLIWYIHLTRTYERILAE